MEILSLRQAEIPIERFALVRQLPDFLFPQRMPDQIFQRVAVIAPVYDLREFLRGKWPPAQGSCAPLPAFFHQGRVPPQDSIEVEDDSIERHLSRTLCGFPNWKTIDDGRWTPHPCLLPAYAERR